MNREEYQIAFNELIKVVSELLEATGNYELVRIVKKRLYDFSDKLQGDRANDNKKQNN